MGAGHISIYGKVIVVTAAKRDVGKKAKIEQTIMVSNIQKF